MRRWISEEKSENMAEKRIEPGKYGHMIQYANGRNGNLEHDLGHYVQYLDCDDVPWANLYSAHWTSAEDHYADADVGHPPHEHKEMELIFLIGTNPEDPLDLGADVDFSLGEEMEHHVISQSCCLVMPGGLIHGSFIPRNVRRPYILFRIHQALRMSEYPHQELLPEHVRKKITHHELWAPVNWD